MIKNLVLIVSIVLLSILLILFAYLLKDPDLCCEYELCTKLTSICEDKAQVLYSKSEKGVKLYINDIKENDTVQVGSTLSGSIKGGWFFEGEFPVRVLNEDMEILDTLLAKATEDWMTEEDVSFELKLDIDIHESSKVILRFERSNPSGLVENDDYIDFPVMLEVESKSIEVKVFFPNEGMGSTEDCSLVYPVIRTIPETLAVGKASLEELFNGLTKEETSSGYYTNLNDGVVIQSLTISNGVARADFSSKLDEGVGGSCKVTSIRAQIEETLKQFPTVNSVIISIDGQIEDILQP
ncbi:MAG: GerMN domain-containing protein [Candidatus Dojkabacteria bacterium]|jgi:hypothetical protein|nr:GerMN domain-containing protein [Candidatus Dojkabacteria bacterium]